MPVPRAILLVSTVAQRQVVERCCEWAWEAGVRPGMDVAQARALLPLGSTKTRAGCPCHGVRVEEFVPERDAAALEALARWSLRFSPLVAVGPPDGLMMDIAGCQRLFGGERRLARRVGEGVVRLGFMARVCVAPTFGCAWGVARYGRIDSEEGIKAEGIEASRSVDTVLVPEGSEREVLEPLPVRALRIGEETVEALREIGITRVGEVMRLPREMVPARFGPELLMRLDRALGRAEERIEPVRAVAPVRAERSFDGAATQIEAIEIASRELLEELCAELEKRQRGTRRIDVELTRLDATPVRIAVTLGRARRSVRHLWSLLKVRLEGVNLGYGVERIAMTATGTSRLRHEQLEWREKAVEGSAEKRAEESGEAWEMIDTLVNRLGPERVLRAEMVESHVPERAARIRAWGESRKTGKQESRKERRGTKKRGGAMAVGAAWGDRPSLLLERPEAARVIVVTPDGPIARLTWRGRERAIVACVGPERIAGEWWHLVETQQRRTQSKTEENRGHREEEECQISNFKFEIAESRSGDGHRADAGRDYFRVQDEEGRWLWVFREAEPNRWFVHGEWA